MCFIRSTIAYPCPNMINIDEEPPQAKIKRGINIVLLAVVAWKWRLIYLLFTILFLLHPPPPPPPPRISEYASLPLPLSSTILIPNLADPPSSYAKWRDVIFCMSVFTKNNEMNCQCCVWVQVVKSKSESESSPLSPSPSHHLRIRVRKFESKNFFESESRI